MQFQTIALYLTLLLPTTMSHTVEIESVPMRDPRAAKTATAELKAQGINVSWEENAVPRMFYPDQLQQHLGMKSEICPFVLRVHDANYDVGFIPDGKGGFRPIFDDYDHDGLTAGSQGKGGIKRVLAGKGDAKVKHWSGAQADTKDTRLSIGKWLQAYSKHALINSARNAGYTVSGTRVDAAGRVLLTVNVPG